MDSELKKEIKKIRGSLSDLQFFVIGLIIAFGYYSNPKKYEHRAAIFSEYPLAQVLPYQIDQTANFHNYLVVSKTESIYKKYNINTEKEMDNDLTFGYLGNIDVNREVIDRLLIESEFSVSENLRSNHPRFVSLLFDFKEQEPAISNSVIQDHFNHYADADSSSIEEVYRDWREDLMQQISIEDTTNNK